MQLIWLFFSFSGRIPRKSFWLATLILLASSMAFSTSLAGLFKIGWSEYWLGSRRTALLDLVTIALFAWPNLAVNFKRLHDCGHSGWRAAVVEALIMMLALLQYGGYDTGDTLTIVLFNIHLIITLLLFLWIMVEMGFFRGDPNANEYGLPQTMAASTPRKAGLDQPPGSRSRRRLNGRQIPAVKDSPIGPHHVSDA